MAEKPLCLEISCKVFYEIGIHMVNCKYCLVSNPFLFFQERLQY